MDAWGASWAAGAWLQGAWIGEVEQPAVVPAQVYGGGGAVRRRTDDDDDALRASIEAWDELIEARHGPRVDSAAGPPLSPDAIARLKAARRDEDELITVLAILAAIGEL